MIPTCMPIYGQIHDKRLQGPLLKIILMISSKLNTLITRYPHKTTVSTNIQMTISKKHQLLDNLVQEYLASSVIVTIF